MGSNEATPEMKMDHESHDNSSSSPSDGGSNDSNRSCVDDLTAIPKLKESQTFIPFETPHSPNNEVELKELSDGDSSLKQVQDQLKNNDDDMVDICTAEEESMDDSLLQNVDLIKMEEAFSFSGEFDDSKVRELIVSDPFIKQVVDSFLMHCDLRSNNEQNIGNNACANGGSTLSVSDVNIDIEMSN